MAETRKRAPEEMSAFFTARAGDYDTVHVNNIGGFDCYIETAKYIPEHAQCLLDLGCGTGLELGEIFKRFPELAVTGIDLSKTMLEKLKEKFLSRNIKTYHMSYFDYDYPYEAYDAAVSVMTLHHFSHEEKTNLYRKIFGTLKKGGRYAECDYMVTDQKLEDELFEARRLVLAEKGNPPGFFHIDTPCTVDNQIAMLKEAGFKTVRQVYKKENAVILTADK